MAPALSKVAAAASAALYFLAPATHGFAPLRPLKRREGGVPKAAPKPPAPPPPKPKAEVVPRWQRDYAEGRPVYAVARDSYPGGEPRDGAS